MKQTFNILLHLIVFVVFAMSFIYTVRFLEVDICLDAGGAMNYLHGKCIGYREKEYTPILWRNNIVLWTLITTLSSLPALLIRYLGIKIMKMR